VADPGFARGAQLARLLGTVALRLGQAPVLPFRFSHYTDRLEEYSRTAAQWPVPADGHTSLGLDFAPLDSAIARAVSQAALVERRVDDAIASGRLNASAAARLNDALARMEQRLLDESEPPDKRWYRHVIYGWDIYSLYDGQPFPGLAQAVRTGDAAGARRELARVTAAVERLSTGLGEAATLARALSPRNGR
jgi:N-acetylated-alpha-linked acidic dipeptidase